MHQHNTAPHSAFDDTHCDFTRCRRRPRSQRGRQLWAVVTLSLYRRTRNSGDVKNGSKGAEGEAPFPLSAATVRTQPLVTSRNDAPWSQWRGAVETLCIYSAGSLIWVAARVTSFPATMLKPVGRSHCSQSTCVTGAVELNIFLLVFFHFWSRFAPSFN